MALKSSICVPIRLLMWAELAELLQGSKPGCSNNEAITVFKSVGASLDDLAAAIEVWEMLDGKP